MKPFVIGIAGGSASGKTTLAKKLASYLENYKVYLMHMDDYFLPFDKHPMIKGIVTEKLYRDDNSPKAFDLDKLIVDLKSLIASNDYEIIILEGLLTLTIDEIFSLLDLKLFIDCQNDERIVRRLKRNMQERGLSFDEIALVYLDVVRYLHVQYVEIYKWRADMIINGSNLTSNSLEMLLLYIKKHLEN